MKQLIVIHLFIFLPNLTQSARILAICSTPSYSHQMAIRPVIEELSNRGHEIVFATTHLTKKEYPNIRQIDLSFSNKLWKEGASKAEPDMFKMLLKFTEILVETNVAQMEHPEIQNLIKNETEHFDLCLIECATPTFFIFKSRFKSPMIGFLSMDVLNRDHKNFGNGYNAVLYPDSMIYVDKSDTFYDRIYEYFMSVTMEFHTMFIVFPIVNKMIKEHFGNGYPKIQELVVDVDMLFTTANKVLHNVRPLSPATISIGGGIHIKQRKELQKPLKEYMDTSERGVIYISFGSNVNTAQLPQSLLQMFFNAFAELPYDVLWKFEEENIPNKPANVKLMKWLPQQDLLRHKNVKVFITHAGLQSSEEGLLFKVPMLAIPFFADQPYNAHQIARKGIGIMVENLESLTSKQLKSSILELINNQTYRNNLNILANIVRDEPMTPLEKAVWWTEYVLRHKGAKHLRGPVVSFYQHYLLDIFAFLLLIGSILIYITYKIVKYSTVNVYKLVFKSGLKLKQM